jgi:DNA-binding NarL/FixJ family response regulator
VFRNATTASRNAAAAGEGVPRGLRLAPVPQDHLAEIDAPAVVAIGGRDFSHREVRLLEFFHGELRPLIGRQLVSASEPSPENLSRRLRQTLACLAEGDGEKQVAARLGISPTTVHQYVTVLYRRFGVQSRSQLLAHVLPRSRRADWTRPLGDMPSDRPAGSA